MDPEIVVLAEIKLIGMSSRMSFENNTTPLLWQKFMPKASHIKNRLNTDLYSVEVYDDPLFFRNFDPAATFEKWATVNVSDLDTIPMEMNALVIPKGKYAVFKYKGMASGAPELYRYIYSTWIPNSEYKLDNRPHFAVMGENYKSENPESEEEIFIPVKEKQL